MNYIGLLISAFGLFAIICSILNVSFFMNSRKAQRLSRLITPTGARIFYTVLGLALLGLGIMIFIGIVS